MEDQTQLISALTKRVKDLEYAMSTHRHLGSDLTSQIDDGGSSGIVVTDGTTTVTPTVEISFSGATVTDAGSGVVDVTIAAAAAGSNHEIQWNNSGILGASPDFIYTSSGGINVKIGTNTPSTSKLFLGGTSTIITEGGYGLEVRTADVSSRVAGPVTITAGAGSVKSGDVIVRVGQGGGGSDEGGSFSLQNNIGGTTRSLYKVGSLSSGVATPVFSLEGFQINSDEAGYIRAKVVGHRFGGPGSAGDMFATEIVRGVKSVAGVVSLVSSLTFVFFYQDVATTDAFFAVSGNKVYLGVVDTAAGNYNWNYELSYISVN